MPLIVLSFISPFMLTGCFMSDPEPISFGFRVTADRIDILIPVCLGSEVDGIDVYDPAGGPTHLVTASGAGTPGLRSGTITIWESGAWVTDGFSEYDVFQIPSRLPKKLEVDYRKSTGSGSGDVVDVEKAAAAELGPDHYWTYNGVKTADEIRAQMMCESHVPS